MQIASGKKVFVSNAGLDVVSLTLFRKAGDPDQPYNDFYAAMKNGGHYELVTTPADADLVFEIRFTAPIASTDKVVT